MTTQDSEASRALGWPSTLARIGFVLAVLCGAAAALGGPGYQQGWWGLGGAFTALRWAAYGAIGALCISVAAVAMTLRASARSGLGWAALGVLIAGVTVGVPWSYLRTARSVPPIHDITTDIESPPLFVAILPLRADAPNPAEYGGAEIADQQRQAYPDLTSEVFSQSLEPVFEAALAAAEDAGWEIAEADVAAGRIEATDTTFWFGFEDDVVVRITRADAGSRVDVRSVSRVGRSDVGKNAERIRAYLAELAARLRS